MKFLLSLIVLMIITFAGTKFFSGKKDLSLGIKNIFFTGLEYIIVGFILGPVIFNILDGDSIVKFEPFTVFGLTWIGFLFGIQFEFKQLKKLPKKFFSITIVQGIFTFISVFLAINFIPPLFLKSQKTDILISALILGSISVSTAPSALSIVNKNFRFRNRKLFDLLRYISSVDSLLSIIIFSFLVSYLVNNNFPGISILLFAEWILITILIGVIPAFFFSFILKLSKKHYDFIAILIGIIAFTGGLAFHFNHSSLVSGFFGGIILANLCRKRVDAIIFLQEAEKSIYILILLLLGASLDLSVSFIFIFFAIFFLFRVFGKFTGNFIAIKLFPANFSIPNTVGLALLSEGGIGFAILIDFHLLFPQYGKIAIVIVLLSAAITELISPKLILSQFSKKDPTKNNDFSEDLEG